MTEVSCDNEDCIHSKDGICQKEKIEITSYIFWKEQCRRADTLETEFDCYACEYPDDFKMSR